MVRKRSRNEGGGGGATHNNTDTDTGDRIVLGDDPNALPGSRKKRPPPPPAANELDLEKLIFGGSSSLLSHPSTSSKRATGEDILEANSDDEHEDALPISGDNALADGDLFMVDTAGNDDDGQLQDDQPGPSSSGDSDSDSDDDILVSRIADAAAGPSNPTITQSKRTKRCVWTDPDDAALTIDLTRNNNLAANGSASVSRAFDASAKRSAKCKSAGSNTSFVSVPSSRSFIRDPGGLPSVSHRFPRLKMGRR